MSVFPLPRSRVKTQGQPSRPVRPPYSAPPAEVVGSQSRRARDSQQSKLGGEVPGRLKTRVVPLFAGAYGAPSPGGIAQSSAPSHDVTAKPKKRTRAGSDRGTRLVGRAPDRPRRTTQRKASAPERNARCRPKPGLTPWGGRGRGSHSEALHDDAVRRLPGTPRDSHRAPHQSSTGQW